MADYYGTSAGFQAYWEARRNAIAQTFTDDDEINAALLVASEWLDAAFLGQFGGLKVGGRDQVREWPRSGVQDVYGYSIADDVPPREVENATYEAAFRQLTTPGVFFKDYAPGKYKSVSITGALSVEYATGSAFDFQTQMPQIGAILAPILTGAQGNISPLSGSIVRV